MESSILPCLERCKANDEFINLGKWEQAVEQPELAVNGKFKLIKPINLPLTRLTTLISIRPGPR